MKLKLEFESFQDFASRLWPCLSEDGMWVPSEEPAEAGDEVEFDVALADGFRLFHGSGRVVSVGAGPEEGPSGQGVLIAFDGLDKPSRNLVRKVISKHLAEGGTKFEPDLPAAGVSDTEATEKTSIADEPFLGVEPTVVGVEPTVVGGGLEEPVGGALEAVEENGAAENAEIPFEQPTADGGEWTADTEPELTSFLRPSGEDAELEPPAIPEMPVEPTLPGSPLGATETDADDPLEFDTPATEPEDFTGTFEEAPTVETPAVETPSFDLESGETEPLPSTFVPPAEPAAVEMPAAESEWAESATEEWAVEPSRTNWWPWLIIAVLGVGVGLFFANQLGLGGWGPTEEESSVVAGDGSSAEMQVPPTRLPAADEVVAGDAASADPAGPASGEAATGGEEGAEAAAGSSSGVRDAVSTGEPVPDAAAASSELATGGSGGAPAEESSVASTQEDLPTEQAPAVGPSSGAAPAVETDGSDAAGLDPVRLQKITWKSEGGNTVITLRLDRSVPLDRIATVDVATGAPRHVIKIDGISGSVPSAVPIGSEHVDQLRFGKHRMDGGMQLHVVADLTGDGVDLVESIGFVGRDLLLRFGRP